MVESMVMLIVSLPSGSGQASILTFIRILPVSVSVTLPVKLVSWVIEPSGCTCISSVLPFSPVSPSLIGPRFTRLASWSSDMPDTAPLTMPPPTMPTKPPSIGMSTRRSDGEIMRADRARATSR